MNVVVESDGTYISLKHEKEHFTLYTEDLRNLYDNNFEIFCKEVIDYLTDVLPDEGYRDWKWKFSDVIEACKKVYKHFKK